MVNLELEQRSVERPPTVEFGPFIKVSSVLVSEIRGNPYILNPARVGEILGYLEDPSHISQRSRRKETDLSQLTVFDESSFEDGPILDIPQGMYNWLNTDASLTPDNVSDQIAQMMGREGLRYSTSASKYLSESARIGQETDLSNAPFALNLTLLLGKFRIEGQAKRSGIDFVGRFDEVRQADGEETIIRIRQRKGRPSLTDAIHLAFDYMAYRASSGSRIETFTPRLIVFNLVDGKSYELRIFSNAFFREIINAMVLAYLAREAGYVPEDSENPFEINLEVARSKEKKIEIWTKKRKETLTASEAFKKAKNSKDRLLGRAPFSSSKFGFVEIKSEVN